MPNRKNGKFWASYQQEKAKARRIGFYLTKQVGVSQLGNRPLPLRLTFFAPDKRKRDLDNLLAAMKPSLDGMAQALGVDDSLFYPITIDKSLDPNKIGFVEVLID